MEGVEKSSKSMRANGCTESNIEVNGEKEFGFLVLISRIVYFLVINNKRLHKILGGVVRGSNRCFLVQCPNNDRSAPTLQPIIMEHIAPHTTILSEAWLA